MQCQNMAIWISWNIDIPRSLNSRDSFPRRKFENRTLTSYRPGPILSPTTISFELHAKVAEEIDPEKCNFKNFRSAVTLTLGRVEVILVHIWSRSTNTPNYIEIRKPFCGRTDTDGWTHLTSVSLLCSSPGDDLKITKIDNRLMCVNVQHQCCFLRHNVHINYKHWDSAHLRQGTSWSGLPPKFNHMFIGQLPTFPENFMQMRPRVVAQSC